MLIKVWLRMSELLDKQVNESLKKSLQGSHKLRQAYEIVCDENERKYVGRKNVFAGRKNLISCIWKSDGIDFHELEVNDSSNNGHTNG